MNRSSLIPTLLAVPLLGACDILDSGDTTAALIQPTQMVSGMQPGSLYDPKYTDGVSTNESAIKDGGLSGFIANLDGTISEVNVRISEDTSIAYVSIDGGPETEWSTKDSTSTNYGRWVDGTDQLSVWWGGDSEQSFSFNGTGYGQSGRFGLETPIDALPAGDASYNGYWYTYNNEINSNADGQMELDLDFATGEIDGLIAGTYNRYAPDAADRVNELIIGTVDGSISGGRIAGTAFVDTNDLSGELDFMGAIYGPDGTRASGAMGGTLTSGAGEDPLHGNFYLQKDGYLYSGH